MEKKNQKNSQMIILFVISCGAFTFPILSLFSSKSETLFGVPLLYVFLYVAWFVLIGLIIIITGAFQKKEVGPVFDPSSKVK